MKSSSQQSETCESGSGSIRRVNVCGLWIHDLTLPETIEEIHRLAGSGQPHAVFTPNVDHVVLYHRCHDLRRAYTRASLVLPDSFYVVLASRLLGKPLRGRVMGSALFPAFCREAATSGLRPFILGGAPGSAERAVQVLNERFPGLQFAGTCLAPAVSLDDDERNRAIAQEVKDAGADVVFVAFGAPKQEIWIARYLEFMGGVVAVGIGAAIDFVAGLQHAPPDWVQRMGLGWLDRLIHNPRRLARRYLFRDPLFLWLLLRQRIFGETFER
ncbi:MAG: WecB/TagA/CpsF family glycosyltransferase [Armatimonadetes bacterium]|nr:WecB/TagA/CpsF family glycosyltransferase [Armatimonadota bacterium]NIM24645.1 WecB/TagA/CpsF family glycosyltransferase [Armatimonadota bacterium]NIM68524.1 WecB/TagA/CpsF family glycosyltransferase [Armatimonadota bacterium]NIM76906.1 WecB/TagA/CpsF family glycosyltransferase [Armatimonadota bacterium]NIN06718.1 WecB/TagA/CpsF family glycosyltransferase [Armatimonadota bacterium]